MYRNRGRGGVTLLLSFNLLILNVPNANLVKLTSTKHTLFVLGEEKKAKNDVSSALNHLKFDAVFQDKLISAVMWPGWSQFFLQIFSFWFFRIVPRNPTMSDKFLIRQKMSRYFSTFSLYLYSDMLDMQNSLVDKFFSPS